MIRSIRMISRCHYENLGGMKMAESKKGDNGTNDDNQKDTKACLKESSIKELLENLFYAS